jgi:hypothetical protein
LRNFLGAFADGAILFPLLAAISLQGSMSSDRLLVTAGLAYIATGLWFKIPMPVQPLKSIAIAAVAVHASGLEIRSSGAILGAVCLILACAIRHPKVRDFISAIPPFFIRALQTALGVILIIQGLKTILPLPLVEQAAGAMILIFIFAFSSLPLLGAFATLGLIAGVFFTSGNAAPANALSLHEQILRPSMVLGLVLPQIALTFANSVLSTKEVAKIYYPEKASRVTEPALLTSIGIGNLLSALLGGLPYCHGAGGLTAHYKGGARSYHANLIIGFTLVLFGILTHLGGQTVLQYPLFLLGALLIGIGWFHFGIVAIQRHSEEKGRLVLVGAVAAATHTMTLPLMATIAICLMDAFRTRTKMPEGAVHDSL